MEVIVVQDQEETEEGSGSTGYSRPGPRERDFYRVQSKEERWSRRSRTGVVVGEGRPVHKDGRFIPGSEVGTSIWMSISSVFPSSDQTIGRRV